MSSLMNRVAIVTGASSGIGRATALLFAREGARVVAGARRQGPLDELVDEITRTGGAAVALAGDVQEESYAKALVETAVEHFSGLDIAFNNAGTVGAMGPTPELSRADWDETLAINLSSAFLAAKYQIPAMLKRGGGSIVFTSTFLGYSAALPNLAAYAASKSGLIGLTQALAMEVATRGIRVNALLPGGTDTPMAREVATTAEAQQFVRDLHAMKRIATPDEIARSVLYLASDASSFTTGTALLVDGGLSIYLG
jgi:NAD(P)-dependent dehydrogenase (short-subunit alcohol dehydrogenase family)